MIRLSTEIAAPREIVFDLARNIDLHNNPDSPIGEKAVAGITSGLISQGETVTWEGKPFGIRTHHTTKVIEMQRPDYFLDVQIKGRFKTFRHRHVFEEKENKTLMRDEMEIEFPGWVFGKMIAAFVLKPYLRKFLLIRNAAIRKEAEKKPQANS